MKIFTVLWFFQRQFVGGVISNANMQIIQLSYSAKNTIKQKLHLRTKLLRVLVLLFYLCFALIAMWQNANIYVTYVL